MMESFLDGKVVLFCGDCRDVLKNTPDNSVDAACMDPPYALVSIGKRFGKDGAAPAKHGTDGLYARASAGFMGQDWDTGETVFAMEFWQQVLRVLKPGAHLFAFSGTRTYHRMACAIEDAGFEIRDQFGWTYGTGFPKSHDVSLAIDKAAGVKRVPIATVAARVGFDVEGDGGGGWAAGQVDITEPVTDEAKEWDGWGTAVKPAWEPIVLARKPLSEKSVAANVLRWGTGALNIDGCRIHTADSQGFAYTSARTAPGAAQNAEGERHQDGVEFSGRTKDGRFPANLIHDGSAEVLAAFPDAGGQQARSIPGGGQGTVYGDVVRGGGMEPRGDEGSAARFFYSAKADGDDRLGSKHPTVKPVDVMQWLCRLITPPGGLVLDAFAGTGTTGEAAFREGFRAVLIERAPKFQDDIRKRMALALRGSAARKRAARKTKSLPIGGMFGDE